VTPKSTQRTNEQWLEELRLDGAAGASAQHALRELVAGAVRKATSSRGALDEATLDDLVQVASMHVLDHLDRFEGRSRFTTWAFAVAVRAAFSELRKSTYRSTGGELSTSGAGELESETPGPTRWAEQGEIVEIMHRVIADDLTERQRKAILGELSGASQEELLAELGINRNALYKLVHDARKKLKQGLGAAGICDDQVRGAFDL